MPKPTAKTPAYKKPSKLKIADMSVNDKVAKLLELAASAPKQTFKEAKSSAKLFELVVLADILEVYSAVHGSGTVRVKNASGNILYFAGAPASANKSVFSYFELLDAPGGNVVHEAWVSVEVLTLSWRIANSPPGYPHHLPLPMSLPMPAQTPRSGKHEIDVGLFEPLPASTASGLAYYPPHTALHAGFSCKHFLPLKESVREALGIRRETAFLSDSPWSTAPWLVSAVPADPPSPLFLVSSLAGVYAYQSPVDRMGIYMMAVPFAD